jgi:C-terminal domain of 1-Cys peroxiredoxin
MTHTFAAPKFKNDACTVSNYRLKPDKTIALIMTYPASTGRNMKELLRCIDAVQLTHVSQVATPVNWKRGDECLVDLSLNDEEADQVFGVDGYRIIKVPSEVGLGTRLPRHYMRYTKDPSAGFVRRMIQRMLQRPKPPKQ